MPSTALFGFSSIRRSLFRQPHSVQKSIYKTFVEAMTEKAKKIKLGPPLEP